MNTVVKMEKVQHAQNLIVQAIGLLEEVYRGDDYVESYVVIPLGKIATGSGAADYEVSIESLIETLEQERFANNEYYYQMVEVLQNSPWL